MSESKIVDFTFVLYFILFSIFYYYSDLGLGVSMMPQTVT